jgi:hypothetical protein
MDDAQIRLELRKVTNARLRGKMIATTTRLNELLEQAREDRLRQELRLEICNVIAGHPSDQPISITDWGLALELLGAVKKAGARLSQQPAPEAADGEEELDKTLNNPAKALIPLFDRLNKDFWARSVGPRLLFTQDVATLHNHLGGFLRVLREYADALLADHEEGLYIRVEILRLQHLHHQPGNDIGHIALSVLRKLGPSAKRLFDDETTLKFRVRATVLLGMNLAARGQPNMAAQVVRKLPKIPDSLPLEKILYNRGLATIGLSAFSFGHYCLAYESLWAFRWPVQSQSRGIGQSPPIYPPWLLIDPAALRTCAWLSAMLLDLAQLTVQQPDDWAIVALEWHKELQKDPSDLPDGLERRVAVCIGHAQKGDWEEAFLVLGEDLFRCGQNTAQFRGDLKCASLRCFLLTGSRFYNNVSVAFLAQKFDLTQEDVVEVVQRMFQGFGPIDRVRVEFRAQLVDDNQYLIFEINEIESLLVHYGAAIRARAAAIAGLRQSARPWATE